MTQRANGGSVTREQLIELLNQDLSREYQAIIAYVVYSQVLKGAQYMKIADELELHAGEELQHAILLSNQIDYLGGMPTVKPLPVKVYIDEEPVLAQRYEVQSIPLIGLFRNGRLERASLGAKPRPQLEAELGMLVIP